jgi:hypothetical protein
MAAVGEPSRATTVVARPQQEVVAAAAVLALLPRDPHQGHGRTRSESRSARGREAIEAPACGDSAPRRGRSRRSSGPAPRSRARGASGVV